MTTITDKHGFDIDSGDGFGECPGCGDADVVFFRVRGTSIVVCSPCSSEISERMAERYDDARIEGWNHGDATLWSQVSR